MVLNSLRLMVLLLIEYGTVLVNIILPPFGALFCIHSLLYFSDALNLKQNSPPGANGEVFCVCVCEGVNVSNQSVHILDPMIYLMLRRTPVTALHSIESLNVSG